MLHSAITALLGILCAARTAHAQVIEFSVKHEWESAVEAFTTLDFTGFEPFTIITDQYADLGIIFTDGNDRILGPGPASFPNDGWGLNGGFNSPIIVIEFASPQQWIAADFPGSFDLLLFKNGELLHKTTDLGELPIGNFAGVFSLQVFDAAILECGAGFTSVNIDDLHFGGVLVPQAGDVVQDGTIDILDFLEVILHWGECPEKGDCPADTNDTGSVNVADLYTVIVQWS